MLLCSVCSCHSLYTRLAKSWSLVVSICSGNVFGLGRGVRWLYFKGVDMSTGKFMGAKPNVPIQVYALWDYCFLCSAVCFWSLTSFTFYTLLKTLLLWLLLRMYFDAGVPNIKTVVVEILYFTDCQLTHILLHSSKTYYCDHCNFDPTSTF